MDNKLLKILNDLEAENEKNINYFFNELLKDKRANKNTDTDNRSLNYLYGRKDMLKTIKVVLSC